AQFFSVTTATRFVTITSPITVGQIQFDSPQTYGLQGFTPASLTFDVTAGNAAVTVTDANGSAVQGISVPTFLADNLDVNVNVNVRSPTQLRVGGPISGPGGITKNGEGELVFVGTADNTYGGVTRVNQGVLTLGSAPFFAAVPGSLIIGDGVGR